MVAIILQMTRTRRGAGGDDAGGSGSHGNDNECDRTAQFIQDQVRLSPFNTLTRTYFHLYKPSSPSSVTKDLGKSTSQPRSHD